MVHIFIKMLLFTVYFSGWLMSLWSPNMLSEVNVMLHELFTSCYIDVSAGLKHWLSDCMRQDTDCKVVLFLLAYLRMFSHVYFVLKLVLMWRRWSVHVRLALAASVELRRYSHLSLHIKQRQNSIYCLNTAIQWT